MEPTCDQARADGRGATQNFPTIHRKPHRAWQLGSYFRHHDINPRPSIIARICHETPAPQWLRAFSFCTIARILHGLPVRTPQNLPISWSMASIQRSGAKWRAQVYVKGVRDSDTFRTRQEAAAWALVREAEMGGTRLPDKTFADAMKRYAREVAPDHAGVRWEAVRLNSMLEWPIAKRKLANLTGADFADWRDGRLRKVKPATVVREKNLLRSVLESARRDWQWIRTNPMQDVRWPQLPKGRKRRLSTDEVDALAGAFGIADALLAETATQRVGLAFLFALETAMRSSEICALTWSHIHLSSQYVTLPKTKNGDARDVALSMRAVEILRALPKGDGPAFGVDDALRDALWRKVRDTTPHKAIHFHDTRAEAIWRLSKKLDVLQLARMIGHRDPRSLLIYYDESAADMAKRLG